MSTAIPSTIYTYQASANWKWHRGGIMPWDVPNVNTYEQQLTSDFAASIGAQMADKVTAAGHWFKLVQIVTTFQSGKSSVVSPYLLPTWAVDFTGTTVVTFQTDVADPLAHNSPQLQQIIIDSFEQLIAYLGDHPQIVVLIVGAGILTWFAISLIKTGTQAIQAVGQTISSVGGAPGSAAIALGILAVAGLAVYALFFTRQGKKATSKTYQLGRRAYRKIRS